MALHHGAVVGAAESTLWRHVQVPSHVPRRIRNTRAMPQGMLSYLAAAAQQRKATTQHAYLYTPEQQFTIGAGSFENGRISLRLG